MKLHPKTDDVQRLIAEGLTNIEIGRVLHMERQAVGQIRRALGLPNVPRQALSLEEKWQSFTRPVDGGHLEWTGERAGPSRTPAMRYCGEWHTAARIAFKIRTGRDPEGNARAECGLEHCVAPEHVDDTATRTRDREALAALTGRWHRLETECQRAHNYAQHGRYFPDGRRYCDACRRAGQQARRAVSAA